MGRYSSTAIEYARQDLLGHPRRPYKIRRTLLLLSLLIVSLPLFAAPLRTVLFLNSYHPGYTWSDDITRGIQEVLTLEGGYDLRLEYLDTKRVQPTGYLQHFAELLALKYDHLSDVSLIITSDDNAFNFIKSYRSLLGPDIPLIFTGLNNFTPERIAGMSQVTGIEETTADLETARLIIQLHPDITDLVVVHDQTTSGKINGERFRTLAEPYLPENVHIHYLTNITFAELQEALAALPETAVLLRRQFVQDNMGVLITQEELTAMLAETGLPVYSLNDSAMGHGWMVGGFMVTGVSQGRAAGELAQRVLELGVAPDDIPVNTQGVHEHLFDYLALERHGIHEKDLPEPFVLLNPPIRIDVRFIIFFSILLFLLTLAVIALLFSILTNRRLKMSRAQYAESEERTRLILNATPFPICIIDEGSWQILMTNLMFASTYTSLQEYEQPWDLEKLLNSEQVYDPTPSAILSMAQGLPKSPRAKLPHRVQLLRHDGSQQWLLVTVSPLKWDDSTALMIMLIDITEEVHAERIRTQQEKLSAIGMLAGGVAHDFNNQLMAIQGYSELIKMETSEPEILSYNESLYTAAQNAAKLTRQLLSFSRKGAFIETVIDPLELLEQMVDILRRTADRRITVDLTPLTSDTLISLTDPTIPFISGVEFIDLPHEGLLRGLNLHLHGDAENLQNAFLNMGINACDSMAQGGSFTIRLGLVRLQRGSTQWVDGELPSGEYVLIDFADTGEGMSPSVLEKVFVPFFTTKPQGRGTGMGLPAVLGTVKRMNGGIFVASKPGVGTCFRLLFPSVTPKVSDSPDTPPVAPAVIPDPSAASESRRTGEAPSRPECEDRSILVVDDEELIRKLLKRLLEHEGYNVTCAKSGSEAIDIFSRKPEAHPLIVLDMIMPDMRGSEVFSRLKEIDSSVHVIFLTGFSTDDDAGKLLAQGAFAYLVKPIDQALLLHHVGRACCEITGKVH